MNKKTMALPKKIVIFCLLSLLIFGGWLFRLISINNQWPNPTEYSVACGEPYVVDGIRFQILDTKLGTDAEVAQYFNPQVNLSELNDVPNMKDQGWTQLILGVKVRFTNNTDTPIVLDVVGIPLEYNEWYTNGDFLAAPLYNISGESGIKIHPNGSTEYVIPFNLYKEHFSDDYWNNINKLDFYIPIMRYPEKVELMV